MQLIVFIVAGWLVYSDASTTNLWCNETATYKTPAAGTCRGYWECNKGIITFKSCETFHTFDSNQLQCVWNPFSSGNDPCGQQGISGDDLWCSPGKIFKAPVNGLCNSYYHCRNGELTLETCTWPMKFNPKERDCHFNIWPYEFDCWTGSENKTSSTPKPEPTTAPSNDLPSGLNCIKGRNFVQPDPKDCSKYYSCKDGQVTLNECGYGRKFDPLELTCRFSSFWNEVNCSASVKGSTVGPTSTAFTTSAPITSIRPVTTSPPPKQKPNNLPKNLICIGGNYFTAQNNKNCDSYYLCSKGKINEESCPTLHRFNPLTHECDFYIPWLHDSVDCSAQPKKPVCKSGYFFKSSFKGNPKKYYDCSNGTLKEEECGLMQSFQADQQSCVYKFFGLNLKTKDSLSNKDLQGLNCTNPLNTSYPGDCHFYYQCFNGTFLKSECPYGQRYHNALQRCVLMTYCDLLTCYSKGPLCYPGTSYKIPVKGNCNEFSKCNDGIWTKESCPWMHQFNPETLECEFSLPEIYYRRVNCNANPKCDKKPILGELKKTSNLNQMQVEGLQVFKSAGWPTCAVGQKFKAPFSYDCSRYIDCNNGTTKVKSCFLFDRFDPNTLECRFNSPFDPVVCIREQGKPVCNEGDYFKTVFPYDCSKYYECSNKNVTIKTCGWLQKFNPQTLECEYNGPVNGVNCNLLPGQPNCAVGQNFKSIFPRHCDKYYQCKNGTVTEEQCPFWEKFDPATLQCKLSIPYIYSVNCSAVPGSGIKRNARIKNLVTTPSIVNQAVTSEVTTAPPVISDPTCNQGEKFKSVFVTDCQQYYNCINGTEKVEKCSWFKKFNPATLSCRWDLPFYRVNCSAIPGSGLPVYPVSVKDQCKLGKTFNMVDKSDCKYYYSCSDGDLSYEKCGFMMKFDPVSLLCSFDLPFHRVNCSALPGEPICPQKGTLRKPYPGNCNKYYECNEGKLSVEKCGFMEQFHHKKLECTIKYPFISGSCDE